MTAAGIASRRRGRGAAAVSNSRSPQQLARRAALAPHHVTLDFWSDFAGTALEDGSEAWLYLAGDLSNVAEVLLGDDPEELAGQGWRLHVSGSGAQLELAVFPCPHPRTAEELLERHRAGLPSLTLAELEAIPARAAWLQERLAGAAERFNAWTADGGQCELCAQGSDEGWRPNVALVERLAGVCARLCHACEQQDAQDEPQREALAEQLAAWRGQPRRRVAAAWNGGDQCPQICVKERTADDWALALDRPDLVGVVDRVRELGEGWDAADGWDPLGLLFWDHLRALAGFSNLRLDAAGSSGGWVRLENDAAGTYGPGWGVLRFPEELTGLELEELEQMARQLAEFEAVVSQAVQATLEECAQQLATD